MEDGKIPLSLLRSSIFAFTVRFSCWHNVLLFPESNLVKTGFEVRKTTCPACKAASSFVVYKDGSCSGQLCHVGPFKMDFMPYIFFWLRLHVYPSSGYAN